MIDSSPVAPHTRALCARLGRRLLQLAAQAPRDAGAVVLVGGGLTSIETQTEIAEHYPALRVRQNQAAVVAIMADVVDGKLTALWLMRNPDKLQGLPFIVLPVVALASALPDCLTGMFALPGVTLRCGLPPERHLRNCGCWITLHTIKTARARHYYKRVHRIHASGPSPGGP